MSVEDRVLNYLRANPGATPREVADALGMSLASVRVAIGRLRELGQVIRSSRGGYVVRVAESPVATYDYAHATTTSTIGDNLLKTVNELVSKVSELESRISKLEDEVKVIKKSLPKIPSRPPSKDLDKFLSTLRLRHVMSVDEAKGLVDRPLEDYVNGGKAVIVGDLVVSPEFLDSFKSKFPIKVSSISTLSSEEAKLLEALVKTNQAYLFSGVEYRILR